MQVKKLKAVTIKIGWVLLSVFFIYAHSVLLIPLFVDHETYAYGPGMETWQYNVCFSFGVACNVGGIVTAVRPNIKSWPRWPLAVSLALGAATTAYWLVQRFTKFGIKTLWRFVGDDLSIATIAASIVSTTAWLFILSCYFLVAWSYSRRCMALVKTKT